MKFNDKQPVRIKGTSAEQYVRWFNREMYDGRVPTGWHAMPSGKVRVTGIAHTRSGRAYVTHIEIIKEALLK